MFLVVRLRFINENSGYNRFKFSPATSTNQAQNQAQTAAGNTQKPSSFPTGTGTHTTVEVAGYAL